MPKHSKPAKCSFCGREIRYKTYAGIRLAIEGREISFIPDPVEGKAFFVNRNGSVIQGHQVSDGQFGYRLHDCQGIYTNKKAAHVGERR